MMRRVIVIIFALVVGMLITWLTAWLLPRFGPMRIVTKAPPSNVEFLDRTHPAVGALANDPLLNSFGRQQFHGWGYDREVVYVTDGSVAKSATRGRCGWPFRAMFGSDTTGVGLEHAIDAERVPLLPATRMYVGLHFVPTGILWPGFIANTLLYAAIVLGLMQLPGFIRRARRRRRGQCTACGYPIGTSATCTECGRAVTAGLVK